MEDIVNFEQDLVRQGMILNSGHHMVQ
jgi:hypothetical protein